MLSTNLDYIVSGEKKKIPLNCNIRTKNGLIKYPTSVFLNLTIDHAYFDNLIITTSQYFKLDINYTKPTDP
jgi:hypothetical protein